MSWLLCAAFSPHAVKATTLNFYYSGFQESIGLYGTGSGSFSFASGLTTAGLSDLTSFSFLEIQDTTRCGPCHFAGSIPSYIAYEFGFGDLTSFSLTLEQGVPTKFSLETNNVNGEFQAFRVNDLGGGFFLGEFGNVAGLTTFTPEPSSAVLSMLCGLLLAGCAARGAAKRQLFRKDPKK
jgi:hypothetical protein